MPALSGSQVALMQARSGLARSGATRSGYFWPNLVFKINGTDRTSLIEHPSLEVIDNLHEQPNTASLIVRGPLTFSPGHPLVIALGADQAGLREFSGTITRIEQTHTRAADPVVRYLVSAVDHTWKLNRRRINDRWTSTSATTIAQEIISTWTTGFTSLRVQAGLPTIADFPCTNTVPATALTRLCNLIGPTCHWYIDEDMDLHFFTSETMQGPPDLQTSNTGFWDFRYERDVTQVRTRVIVEGKRTTCPIPIIRDGFPSLLYGKYEIPVNSPDPFTVYPTGGLARLGTQRFAHEGLDTPYQYALTNTTVTTADAIAGDTSLQVSAFGGASVWCRVQDQYIYFGDTDTVPDRLVLIPASGQGAITGPIKSGSQVTYLPVLVQIDSDAFTQDQPVDSDVVMYVQVDDAAAQTALAALEGGDGIHEHVESDGRLSEDGATELANGQLDAFAAAIPGVSFTTRSPFARTGRNVVVNQAAPDSVTGTFMIQKVRTRFERMAPRTAKKATVFPIREVTAANVKPRNLVQVVAQGVLETV